jgi:hypothetical protein
MLADSTAGVYVTNTQTETFSGWGQIEFSALRDKSVLSLTDCNSGKNKKLITDDKYAYFWIDNLPGKTTRKYKISYDEAPLETNTVTPRIAVDKNGWPVTVTWPNMHLPLFDGNIGSLTSYEFTQGGWWNANAVLKEHPSSTRQPTKVVNTPYTVKYSQQLENDRLVKAERILEIYKNEPRIKLKIIYDRKLHSQRETEVIYVDFPLPNQQREIVTSNGGSVFCPFSENIANTCKTFYVADSWVAYKMNDGYRVWSSKTSPVVSFGKVPFFIKGIENEPKDSQLLRSMVYNNVWSVNFPAEYSGDVVCEYDLFWLSGITDAKKIRQITDTYIISPVIIVVSNGKEDILYNKWLNEN